MISSNVDLGQLIIGSIVTTVGYFLKRELEVLTVKLDKHEMAITKLVGDVQRVVGYNDAMRVLIDIRNERK